MVILTIKYAIISTNYKKEQIQIKRGRNPNVLAAAVAVSGNELNEPELNSSREEIQIYKRKKSKLKSGRNPNVSAVAMAVAVVMS